MTMELRLSDSIHNIAVSSVKANASVLVLVDIHFFLLDMGSNFQAQSPVS